MGFVLLALWNTEHHPADWLAFDKSNLLILALAVIAKTKKVSVIKILFGSGVLGLAFGLMGF